MPDLNTDDSVMVFNEVSERYGPELVKRIVKLWTEEKGSTRAIGLDVGCSHGKVWQILRELGFDTGTSRTGILAKRRYTTEQQLSEMWLKIRDLEERLSSLEGAKPAATLSPPVSIPAKRSTDDMLAQFLPPQFKPEDSA